MKLILLSSVVLLACACAARVPPRPAGGTTPDPTAIQQFTTATQACRGFRSFLGELSLSGRAGGERIRGRVHAGLERGAAVRLEGVAPFGAPIFILAGRNDRATLLLPRDRRVLKDTAVAAVLERLTGLALGADDLRLILSGCLVENVTPTDGRRWGNGWQAVTLGDRTAYLRSVQGRVVLAAADFGQWRVDYADHQGDWPRTVRVRRADGAADITAKIGELEVNTAIDPAAYTVNVPADADPMTLDELRSVAPLAAKQH